MTNHWSFPFIGGTFKILKMLNNGYRLTRELFAIEQPNKLLWLTKCDNFNRSVGEKSATTV